MPRSCGRAGPSRPAGTPRLATRTARNRVAVQRRAGRLQTVQAVGHDLPEAVEGKGGQGGGDCGCRHVVHYTAGSMARQLVAGDGRVDDLAQAVVAGQWSGLAARPVELIKGAVERGRHARRLFIPEAVGPEEQLDRKGDEPQPEPPHELRRLFRDPPERVVSCGRLVEAPHPAPGQPDPFQPVALLREVELEDPRSSETRRRTPDAGTC